MEFLAKESPDCPYHEEHAQSRLEAAAHPGGERFVPGDQQHPEQQP
jgi:hypothetical protein